MSRNRLLLTMIVFSMTAACATVARPPDDALLLNDSSTLRSPGMVTRDQANMDLDVLIYALENGYGGRKYIPREDLEGSVAELHALGSTAPSSDATWNFCTKMASVLFRLPDNHLSARLNGTDCSQEHEALFAPGQVGKNVQTDYKLPWAISFRNFRGTKVPVISITSFPYHEDQAWNGFLDQIRVLRKSSPAIIIDMRGNGGGDDTIGRKMAAILYGQEPPRSYETIIKSQTPATLALAANNIQLKILRLRGKGEPIPSHLVSRLEEKLKLYHDAKQGLLPPEDTYQENSGLPYDETKAYTRPILILVDRGCQSSCESTVEAFEAHPHAVTIGENTGGFVHFGNMGQLVLPKSKIVIQLATDFWRYKDHRFVEKVGYSPRIRVPAGSDALDVALRELGKQGLTRRNLTE